MARRPPPKRAPVVDLMRTEARHVKALNATLTQAVKDLDKRIVTLPADSLTRLQAEAQRAAMTGFLNSTFDDVERITARGMKDAASAASQMVSRYENVLLYAVFSPSDLKAIAASEARRAVSGLDAALQRIQGASYNKLSQRVYDTKQLASKWVDKTINRGIVSGWSAQQLARELRKSIDPRVPGGVSYAAMRTARTEINNAYHAASVQRYEDSKLVDEVDWNLSSSHPEGDECDSLAAGGPYKIKNVPRKPHPNCYCFITPHLPTEEEFLDNLLAGKYGDEPWVSKIEPDIIEPSKTPAEFRARKTFPDADESDLPRSELLGKYVPNDSIYNMNIYQRASAHYTGPGYGDMNAALRRPDQMVMGSNTLVYVDTMREVTRSVAVKKDVTLHRVISDSRFMGDNVAFDPTSAVGATFTDKGFVSTSYGAQSAFVDLSPKSKFPYRMEIMAPKGTKGSLVDNYEEREFVLAPDTEFTVIDVVQEVDHFVFRVVAKSAE